MEDPVPPDMLARFRQAFLLGLARSPVAPPPALARLDGDPVLALLALTAQRRRFAVPAVPVPGAVPGAARALHDDPRPILPPPARRALAHLARSVEKPASLTTTVMPLALRRIAAAGMRPHPFDLPGLARHVRAETERHGPAERAWLALTDTGAEATEQAPFLEAISALNWRLFPPAQRRRFVADVRRSDPAAGRALVEGVWKTEPAAVRAALLEALATGLGPDDKRFLDGLTGDRAESVRKNAVWLARLASAAPTADRAAEAARWFRRAGRVMAALGIGGRGLTFASPGGKSANAAEAEAERERVFAGLPLAALAAAVGATPAEVVAALPDDEHRVRALLLQQAAADDVDVRGIDAARLLAITKMPAPLVTLATEARAPVDPGTAAQFLAGRVWTEAVAELAGRSDGRDDGRLVCTAALMPPEAIPAFLAGLDAAPPTATRAARDFAALVLALTPDSPPVPAS